MSVIGSSDLIGRAAGGRKLIAVIYADMVGYSRLIRLDDIGTLERLQTLRSALIDPAINEYGGTVVQTGGDSLLIVFDSIEGAVSCAVTMQQRMPDYDRDQTPDRAIRFRIGINIGDVIADGTDLHGDGVNVAARLQAECPPGGICVSRAIRDHVSDRLDLMFDELGALSLKNIARPVEAFVLRARHAPSYLVEPANQGGIPWNGRPRMSVVVLPFVNLSGRPAEEYLADGITDDLTADLSRIAEAVVISRASANAYKGKSQDVRKVGEELGVRYVLEGSVRTIEAILKVNVQLTSTETGAQLWSDRFDEQITKIAAGQERVVARVRDALARSMLEIESARHLRHFSTNPDAIDLVLRARSLRYQPQSLQRDKEVRALFERALLLDPLSVSALTGVAHSLIAMRPAGTHWGNFEDMERTERLLAQAQAIAPESEEVLNATVYWLRSVGRCAEAIEAAQRIIQIDPKRVRVMTGVYNELAICKTWMGYAEEGIALQEQANQLNPRSSARFLRYRRMGWGYLLLGRDQDAITYLQRSLAIKSQVDVGTHRTFRHLAAAYARTGQMEEARQWLTKADRLWPYDTVRGHFPDGQPSTVYAEQIKGYQAALRLAGERDHANEAADFGVPIDGALHSEFAGFTPMDAPGARTIRTADFVGLLADAQPIVIDTMTYSWGRSIPRAVGLNFAGLGGSFTDGAQEKLRSRMSDLAESALDKPIVAVGWNSERFDGRNLALRIAALGYSNVYWYRGGREAWEMSGLPEADMIATSW